MDCWDWWQFWHTITPSLKLHCNMGVFCFLWPQSRHFQHAVKRNFLFCFLPTVCATVLVLYHTQTTAEHRFCGSVEADPEREHLGQSMSYVQHQIVLKSVCCSKLHVYYVPLCAALYVVCLAASSHYF